MKIESRSRITWWLLAAAVILHIAMVGRALFITWDLRAISRHVDERQHQLGKLLALTNRVREAEERIRELSLSPSAAAREEYCSALEAADKAVGESAAAGAVSDAFTLRDIASLRAAIYSHKGSCLEPGVPSRAAAMAEFNRFYETASALRRRLAAHSQAGLDENVAISGVARGRTTQMVVSTCIMATVILALLAWVIWLMRRMNLAISRQSDEILLLKSGIEHSSLGVMFTDTTGKIEYVNRAFTEMYGYADAEVRGKNPRILKSGEMPAAFYESLWKTMLGGRDWSGELRNRTRDGSLIWVRAFNSPIRDSAGKVTHFLALHRNVMLEKHLVTELLHAKKQAEHANRAKSDFLAAMSHEIRTPLNAIVGMSELIDEGALSSDQAQYLAIMRNASDTLLSLINDILDISKIEAGKVEIERVPFNLEELLSKVSEMISVRAMEKKIEVSCKIDADVPVFVEGDATRLRQVLMNLMGNAVKFVDEGWVALSVNKQSDEDGRLQLLFSVRDTGIGIAPEKIQSVFDKFTQADASTTRRYGGTGLGLPISKMLIELMGGKIWLESEPGVGTVFFFTLGLYRQEGKPSVYLPKADVAEIKGLRFLVVDDNLVNRIIIREITQSWGAACEGVPDGESGLARVLEAQRKGAPFHGIFVDFNMPGMDGLEFCRRLTSDPAVSPLPALALATSDSVRFKREDFLALGVKTCLWKPVKKQTILEAVLEMVAAGKAAVPSREAPERGALTRGDLPELSLLVVDDSDDNRVLIASFLKGSRVKLQLAVDGLDSLKKFRSGAYDIVFMDLQMPEMDGFEAAARIRELEAAEGRARTKLVALTAMATREDIDKAMKAGCDDYLTKPIRKNTFYTYLADFAAGRPGKG